MILDPLVGNVCLVLCFTTLCLFVTIQVAQSIHGSEGCRVWAKLIWLLQLEEVFNNETAGNITQTSPQQAIQNRSKGSRQKMNVLWSGWSPIMITSHEWKGANEFGQRDPPSLFWGNAQKKTWKENYFYIDVFPNTNQTICTTEFYTKSRKKYSKPCKYLKFALTLAFLSSPSSTLCPSIFMYSLFFVSSFVSAFHISFRLSIRLVRISFRKFWQPNKDIQGYGCSPTYGRCWVCSFVAFFAHHNFKSC